VGRKKWGRSGNTEQRSMSAKSVRKKKKSFHWKKTRIIKGGIEKNSGLSLVESKRV